MPTSTSSVINDNDTLTKKCNLMDKKNIGRNSRHSLRRKYKVINQGRDTTMISLPVSCSHTCTCCGATEGMECQVTAMSSQQMLPSPADSTYTHINELNINESNTHLSLSPSPSLPASLSLSLSILTAIFQVNLG